MESKLGPPERISCGATIADHGTARITSDWLPFLHGTRQPAVEAVFVAPDDLPDGTPWQLAHLRQFGAWELDGVLRARYRLGETRAMHAAALSPDGRLALVDGGLFETRAGCEIRRMERRGGRYHPIRFLDEYRVRVGERLLSLVTGRETREQPPIAYDVVARGDGTYSLVSDVDLMHLGADGSVRQLTPLPEHRDPNRNRPPVQEFAPDGSWLVRGGPDGITAHHVATGDHVTLPPLGHQVIALAVGPGGSPILATAGSSLRRLDRLDADWQDVGILGGAIRRLAMEVTARFAATIDQRNVITSFDLRTNREIASWSGGDDLHNVFVTTSGLVVAHEFGGPLRAFTVEGGVDRLPDRPTGAVTAVALDPSATTALAVLSGDRFGGQIDIYDLDSGQLRASFPAPRGDSGSLPTRTLAALADGGHIAWTVGREHGVRPVDRLEAWSLASGERIRTIHIGHANSIARLDISDDGLQADVLVRIDYEQYEWRAFSIEGGAVATSRPPLTAPAPHPLLASAAEAGRDTANAPDILTTVVSSADDNLALAGTRRGALVLYRRGRTDGLRVAVEREDLPHAGNAVDAEAETKKADAKRKKSRGRRTPFGAVVVSERT